MDKQTKNLVILGVILVGIFYLGGGLNNLPESVQQTPGAVTTDGVTIYSGTPTLEWYATDAITSAAISPALFRVTIGSAQADKEFDDTLNAAIGDSYKVCLMPNTTYYSACTSGVVGKTTEKIPITAYAIGTATIWINNDPENSTARNGVGAPDTLAASDTDTPTVCFQGATANASYGDGSILVAIDYNANEYETAPTLSVGELSPASAPSIYTIDGNATATVYYEIKQLLTNQQTICGIMTLQNDSTALISLAGESF